MTYLERIERELINIKDDYENMASELSGNGYKIALKKIEILEETIDIIGNLE